MHLAPRIVGLLALISVSYTATNVFASIIDFEVTPSNATPVDNAPLTGSYAIGATNVSFGYDTDLDFVADENVFYELYGGADPVSAYAGDGDLSGLGGSYFLRLPVQPGDALTFLTPGTQFLVTYSGVLPTAASGSIWDIDNGEQFTVSAHDAAGIVLQSISYSTISANNLPTAFSFSGLAGIKYITGTSAATGSPFGFDNFDATGGVVTAVPEPGSAIILLVCAAIGFAGFRLWPHRLAGPSPNHPTR